VSQRSGCASYDHGKRLIMRGAFSWPGVCRVILHMTVVVPIFEVHLVNVAMGVSRFAVGVLVFDMAVIVTDVGVLVGRDTVIMLVCVRALVFVRFIHLPIPSWFLRVRG
jgi:hypothetical protein